MKKVELLAPAGNMKALKAAIMAGCDAVYLGGINFGARAFSKNFDNDEIVEAINYCHLYGVKVYVTVNTLIYENEVNSFMEYIEFLHKNNVDAVIMQDFGMFDLVRKTFPNLEIHASTQMHIHNLDGTLLMEKLGMKRVVLARETSIDTIREIENNSNVELEVFVHGALCISYSGQCLMSSLIGGRSGNRGACAGSCRLKYDIIDENGKKLNTGEYPLSTKDLNSLEHVGELIDAGIASFKIEGRMKSPEYVYMVVSLYRRAIDSYYKYGYVKLDDEEILKLKKIFNRNFTRGFLFNTSNNDLINGYRPNHMGVPVGKVIEYKKGIARIKLNDNISIGSGLRVIGKKNDVGISVNEIYVGGNLVKKASKGDIISIKVNSDVFVDDIVVITMDKEISDNIEDIISSNLRKVNISGKFSGHVGMEMSLTLNDGANEVSVSGSIVNESVNRPVDRDMICEKLSKLGDTVYSFSQLDIDIDNNIFIPIKEINELRRKAIDKLNELRLYKSDFKKCEYYIDVPDFKKERLVTCLVNDMDKYNNLDRKYDIVYSEFINDKTIYKLPRVIEGYVNSDKVVMIGEIGAFNKLKNAHTDFSLNVVNSYTVAFLHSLGARKITLSYELNDSQIKDIIDNYHQRYGKHPNVELIVNAYEEVMISKFSLNKYFGNDKIYLRDMFKNNYRVITKNNLMYIYNYKKRDNYNTKYYDMGVNSLRINLDI
ncbi:MAG: U32 family peptidase [Bacilli bacterium]|nr:U32 family peptidase [Bacilli bacterium]